MKLAAEVFHVSHLKGGEEIASAHLHPTANLWAISSSDCCAVLAWPLQSSFPAASTDDLSELELEATQLSWPRGVSTWLLGCQGSHRHLPHCHHPHPDRNQKRFIIALHRSGYFSVHTRPAQWRAQ